MNPLLSTLVCRGWGSYLLHYQGQSSVLHEEMVLLSHKQHHGKTLFLRMHEDAAGNHAAEMSLFFFYYIDIRWLSKKFVEFVNTNKTTIPIAFKFLYN